MASELRDIPGYEGFYQITNCGKVYSCRRRKFLNPRLRAGYLAVALYKSGVRTDYNIHRLVLSIWGTPAIDSQVCRHKNGNRQDNNISNLEWGSTQDNVLDMLKHSTQAKGEDIHTSVLNPKAVLDIVAKYKLGKKVTDLCKLYEVSKSTIYYILQGKSWSSVTKIPNPKYKGVNFGQHLFN